MTIQDIEKMQTHTNVSICSLKLGKETIIEFETLLKWYDVDDLQTKLSTLSSPGWYRLQLQYMIAMMNNVMSQIQLEAQTAMMNVFHVRNMPPGKERDAALQELQRKTCPMAGNAPAA